MSNLDAEKLLKLESKLESIGNTTTVTLVLSLLTFTVLVIVIVIGTLRKRLKRVGKPLVRSISRKSRTTLTTAKNFLAKKLLTSIATNNEQNQEAPVYAQVLKEKSSVESHGSKKILRLESCPTDNISRDSSSSSNCDSTREITDDNFVSVEIHAYKAMDPDARNPLKGQKSLYDEIAAPCENAEVQFENLYDIASGDDYEEIAEGSSNTKP